MLEMAILGLLLESPMHGYELRKRLTGLLGAFRAFSYGSLYPTLRRMQTDGLIDEAPTPTGMKVRRGRRVYQLSESGRVRFGELVADTGPQNYTDDGFGVHLAFFSRTPAVARMRILEGRRRQVEERREGLRDLVGRSNRAVDRYTKQLHQLSLESSEREVRWLNELIAAEASNPGGEQVDETQSGTGATAVDTVDTDIAGSEVGGPVPPITTAGPSPSADTPSRGTDSSTTGAAQQERTPVSQRSPAMPREEGEPDHG
ncbi:PadR family transcriptional regulator [Gordonia soli]|uniref:Putative PadR family transcriptional regulator n=1 Tax=Gordonia soli NBRC 108243 TaxID=1223545 RepID=M0QE76_9ACTN|nr:PadR family transcriptional regulator [Gordonia soli]GAC66878.1 putative PadR family transcriptional regulator [Gordonia soli NBRC 108243]